MMFRKATLNFLLEGVTLADLAGLIATGFVLEFTLPPGSRQETQWGLGRHAWGEIHFWLSVGFIVLLLLHLALHWRWIWAMARGRNPATRAARGAAFLLATALLVAICALPWLVPVNANEDGQEEDRVAYSDDRGAGAE